MRMESASQTLALTCRDALKIQPILKMVLILRTQQIAMTVFRGFIFSRIVRATISSLSPAGHDSWRIELIPPEGSGFTTTLLQRQDLSSAQSGLLLSSIPLEASPVLTGLVKRKIDGLEVVAEDILGLWVSLYKKNDEGNYPDLNSPTYRVDAGPEYDPDTFTQTSGGEYSVSVVPGTYLAAVEANDPIAMMIDGIPHANFSLTKMGGTYTAQGMWVPPSITDFEPEFTVTASSQAPRFISTRLRRHKR